MARRSDPAAGEAQAGWLIAGCLELQRALYRDQEVVAAARLVAYSEAARAAEVEHNRIRQQAEAAERLFNELIDNREADRQQGARERAETEYQTRRAAK